MAILGLYTDGACSNNEKGKGTGGFAVVCEGAGGDIGCLVAEHHEGTTNNRMEFMAIIAAIELAKEFLYSEEDILGYDTVEIYSDSNYCVQTITNWMYSWERKGWRKSDKKAPENLDLVKQAHSLMSFEKNIIIKKVKGHSGDALNEFADKCAVCAKKGEITCL